MHAEQSLSTPLLGRSPSQDQPEALRWPFSLLLRLRPPVYPAASVSFANTYYLGFFNVLLLASAMLSGLALLFFYDPRPEYAQLSVRHLADNPALAWVRDAHRFTAELLVSAGLLHLLRVALAGAYKGPRRFTWVGGLGLFLIIIGLWYSGALLLGETHSLAALPAVAEDRGLGALLSPQVIFHLCYLLHVAILPLVAITLFAIHHYRVHWVHGISLPVCSTARRSLEDRRPLPYWPTLARRELRLALAFTVAILMAVVLVYDAPWQAMSDEATLAQISAPWLVLSWRGLFALCPDPWLGMMTVAAIVLPLLWLPWIERRQRRPLGQRRGLLLGLGVVVAVLVGLSIVGSAIGESPSLGAMVGIH